MMSTLIRQAGVRSTPRIMVNYPLPLQNPPADLNVVRQQILNTIGFRQGNFSHPQIVHPVFIDEIFSELPAEGANVA